MTENIKHYVTLALSFFMGPADRGSETQGDYLRRKHDEKRHEQDPRSSAVEVGKTAKAEPEYSI